MLPLLFSHARYRRQLTANLYDPLGLGSFLVVGLALELAADLLSEEQTSVRIRENNHGLLIMRLTSQQINQECVEAGIALTQLRYVGAGLEHRRAADNLV